MSRRDKDEGIKRHLKLLRFYLCDIKNPKKPRLKRSCWDEPPSSIPPAPPLDSASCMPFDSLSARNELIIRHLPQRWSTRQKREQRQKIAQVQFASILPKGMFEITVCLGWEWNLIKVQTSQAAVLFLPRLPHWRFVLPVQCGILCGYAEPSLCHLSWSPNHHKIMDVIVSISDLYAM